MKRWERTLSRLRHAGVRKAAAAVRARVEKKFRPAPPPPPPGPESPEDIAAFFPANCHDRHLFRTPAETARVSQERFPEAAAETIRQADAIRAGHFHFLGRDAHFPGAIDWFWCPETGGSWPALEPGKDEKTHFGEQRPGDIKFPWELNRHQYFTTLAKAYLYTGDEGYVGVIAEHITDWRRANPYGVGHNWLSALELAIRIISWSNALWLCRDSEVFQREAMAPCLAGMYEQAYRLSQKLTTYWLLRNNHLIGEAAGLFVFAALFPHLPESARWQQTALKVLAAEYRDQVYPDGVNVEQATGYHRFITEFLLLVVRLADLNGIAIPVLLRSRLDAMLGYEALITAPDGSVPQIGDCDDGRAFLLSESVPFLDYRGVRAIGRAMGIASGAGNAGASEEALWFLGADDWTSYADSSAPALGPTSVWYKDGGHAVLRRGPWYVLARCGPFGLGENGGSLHSHGDILAPVIHCNGMPLAVDAGTYGYLCATEDRLLFRSAEAHNTFTPADADQGELEDVWNWGRVPQSRLVSWQDDADGVRFVGFMKSPWGYSLQRTMAIDDASGALTLTDVLNQTGTPRESIWRLHLAPGLEARISDSGPKIDIYRGSAPFVGLRYEGFSASRVESAWYSPAYGERTPISRIVLRASGTSVNGRVVFEAPIAGDTGV